MIRPFDPERHCGSPGKPCNTDPPSCGHTDGVHRCRQPRGFRTDHAGTGHCWTHGGTSPNGKKAAAKEAVEQVIARLGVPRGTGDPIALLASAVRHAEGYLEATAQVVRDRAEPAEGAEPAKVSLELAAAIAAYETAMRQAAATGSQTVNAKVAQQLAAVEARKIELLHIALQRALDRSDPDPAWRDRFVVVLGEELLAISAPTAAVAAGN